MLAGLVALLLTPGFATDAVGLLCVLPGSRAVLRRMLTVVVARRLGLGGMAGAFAADRFSARRRPPPGSAGGSVVDGTVVEPPPDAPDPPPPGRR